MDGWELCDGIGWVEWNEIERDEIGGDECETKQGKSEDR